ncbi:hypothetical protein BD410DRAFT_278976 [Rickenella mellea]|uniref:Uncharacterized protein n=1 Tax=Rickenella mellea TaxID=50990 RepID=A0A4Y7Q376_9AGAM|nr:hypothetical protein BD410DRAFT_278976 [Rickenella mellea]
MPRCKPTINPALPQKLRNAGYTPELIPITSLHTSRLQLRHQTVLTAEKMYKVVAHFFDAIIAGQVETVQLLLNSGMDVECQDRLRRGMTPLYAAVRAGQSRMMFLLFNAGADVNKFSGDPDITDPNRNRHNHGEIWRKRTPLMRAAQNGSIKMVRELVEQCNADPMAIAPDDQSAQRLAAKAGHRAVVEYLPINRGGIGKRLRYDYHTRYRRIRYLVKTIYSILKFFLWTVPKFFVWDIPKYVVKMLYRLARHIFSAVRTWPSLIGAALVDLFKAIGRGSMAVVRRTVRGAKSIGRSAVRLVKGVPNFLKTCYNATKRVVKAIPDMTVRMVNAMSQTTMEIGGWILDFFKACYIATKRFVKAIPDMTVRMANAIGRTTVDIGGWILDFFTACYNAIKRFVKAIPEMTVRAAKAIGRTTMEIGGWIRDILKASYNVTKRLVKAIPDMSVRVAKAIGRTAMEIGRRICGFLEAFYNATKRFMRAIPDVTVRVAKPVGRTTMEIGGWIWEFLKACYDVTKCLVKAIPDMTVTVVKAIGRTIMAISRWTWNFMKKIGSAVFNILKAITDVFVTVYFYLESLIRRLRAVKFKDIVRAVERLLRAIFVAFPKVLWGGLKTAVRFVDNMLTCLTLGLWWFVTRLAEWFIRGICFIPEQILRIVLIMVQGIGKMFTELWLLIHPRSMM